MSRGTSRGRNQEQSRGVSPDLPSSSGAATLARTPESQRLGGKLGTGCSASYTFDNHGPAAHLKPVPRPPGWLVGNMSAAAAATAALNSVVEQEHRPTGRAAAPPSAFAAWENKPLPAPPMALLPPSFELAQELVRAQQEAASASVRVSMQRHLKQQRQQEQYANMLNKAPPRPVPSVEPIVTVVAPIALRHQGHPEMQVIYGGEFISTHAVQKPPPAPDMLSSVVAPLGPLQVKHYERLRKMSTCQIRS